MINIQSEPKSHINMVTVLANANARSDASGQNKILILREAKVSF